MRKATVLSDAGILLRTVFASLIPSLGMVRKAKATQELFARRRACYSSDLTVEFE